MEIEEFLRGPVVCPACKVEGRVTVNKGDTLFPMSAGCDFCGVTLVRRGAPIPESFRARAEVMRYTFCFCNMHHGQRVGLEGMEVVE